MRSLVVYNSKTGFTQRYAQWIAAKLNCEAVAEKDMTPKQWQESQTIIYGGPLMAGKVLGWEKIKSRITESGKQAIVYTVGATPMAAEDIIQKVQNDNLSEASSDYAREEYVEPLVEWVEQQKVHI